MIYFNGDIKEVHYGGHDIREIYSCGGNLVWSGSTTPPTPPINLKYKGDYNFGLTKEVECDGLPSLTISEIQTDVPTTIDNLTGITIGACCLYMPNDGFETATNLKQAVLEEGVVSIGLNSFKDLTSFTTIRIPNSLQDIGDYAFAGCNHLSAVTLGNGITTVGEGAFSGCTKMTNNISLPNIEQVKNSAFRGCSGLSSVTLGSECTKIEGSAFKGCKSLQSVTVNATTPPDCAPAAFDDSNNCPIYVPSESVEAYKTKYAWNSYSSRIQSIP